MPVVPIHWILIRDPNQKFAPQALLSTKLDAEPEQILLWFVQRWQTEVTFEEVRTHLGVETQRQWSDKAIARTTPALFALFSIITLMAVHLTDNGKLPIRTAASYGKHTATFSHTIALVRRYLWSHNTFSISLVDGDIINIPRSLLERFIDTLCYAS
jgi:hypothetical protein